MRPLQTLTLCLSLTFPAAAQDQPTKPPAPWPLLETLPVLKGPNPAAPLAALIHLRDNKQRALDDPAFATMYFDILASVSASVGDHAAALKAESESLARSAPRDDKPVDLTGYHGESAPASIIAACKDHRILMLNEEHRISLQRAFLADLLPDLRREGFTHLALEALGEDGEALQARGYPVLDSGLYTMDPQFAEAVRLAISLGLHVVKYEPDRKDIGPEPGDRDRRSAQTLATLLDKDPKARLLVYAGRYHIAKRGDATWTPLAARLKEMTGTEPLCVDLIALRECGQERDEHPAFRAALAAGLVTDAPVVLVNGAGRRFSHWPDQDRLLRLLPAHHDPRRPARLALPGTAPPCSGRRPPPTHHRTDAHPRRPPGESASAVPADQLMVEPGRAVPCYSSRPAVSRSGPLPPRGGNSPSSS
jgi:hypothetical protein